MPKDCAGQVYPGSDATALEMLDLAPACRAAARALFARTGRDPLAAMPATLRAPHGIELAINGWHRHGGPTPEAIRKRRHDLSCPHVAAGPGLRRKTARHMSNATAGRAYLSARHAPGSSREGAPRTRMTATLDEILSKVARRIDPGRSPARTPEPLRAHRTVH